MKAGQRMLREQPPAALHPPQHADHDYCIECRRKRLPMVNRRSPVSSARSSSRVHRDRLDPHLLGVSRSGSWSTDWISLKWPGNGLI